MIHYIEFPGTRKFDDEQREWSMNPIKVNGEWVEMFWMGREHMHWLGAEWLTYESPFYEISREQLWEEINDRKCGLRRFFRNEQSQAKYGRPTIHVPSLRVSLLIQAAHRLHERGQIALMYEDNLEQAMMIARAIEWVRHIIFEVGDYKPKAS